MLVFDSIFAFFGSLRAQLTFLITVKWIHGGDCSLTKPLACKALLRTCQDAVRRQGLLPWPILEESEDMRVPDKL